jgi:colanic acid/amylovoran biosynthesis protein
VKERRPLLGVTLLNWEAQFGPFQRQAAYETAVVAAIRHFIHVREGHVALFAQVRGPTRAEDDRVPARRVYGQLADVAENVTFIESDPSPMELKAAYGLMDLFIGTRLHSNIFALSENVPAVLIQYQYKTRGIARMLGLEKWVLEIESVIGEQLCAALDQLWREREQIQAHIQERMQHVQTQIAQIGPMIVQDFRQGRHG